MNLNKFLFKFTILGWRTLLTMVLFFPFVLILINLKDGNFAYGNEFFEKSFGMALFGSFAFSMVLNASNALLFEEFRDIDLKYYLKTNQVGFVRTNKGTSEVISLLNKPFSLKTDSATELHIEKRNRFTRPDKMTIRRMDGGYELTSRPRIRLALIDFGRNYKNLKLLAKTIKYGE